MKRIVIVGASSGIGREVAKIYIARGWRVGLAARRREELETLAALAPERVCIRTLDVTREEAPEILGELIGELGGMDLYFHSSGIGSNNLPLTPQIEIDTLRTNGEGFVRMITTAFHHFKRQGGGHIAAISSIAGTRGLGSAPAYSATKRMQNCYLDALAQLSHLQRLHIRITDLRPGFVATPLLADDRYPMMLSAPRVARQIVRAIDRGCRRKVIDWRYALLVLLWRMIPEGIWERLPIRKQ